MPTISTYAFIWKELSLILLVVVMLCKLRKKNWIKVIHHWCNSPTPNTCCYNNKLVTQGGNTLCCFFFLRVLLWWSCRHTVIMATVWVTLESGTVTFFLGILWTQISSDCQNPETVMDSLFQSTEVCIKVMTSLITHLIAQLIICGPVKYLFYLQY